MLSLLAVLTMLLNLGTTIAVFVAGQIGPIAFDERVAVFLSTFAYMGVCMLVSMAFILIIAALPLAITSLSHILARKKSFTLSRVILIGIPLVFSTLPGAMFVHDVLGWQGEMVFFIKLGLNWGLTVILLIALLNLSYFNDEYDQDPNVRLKYCVLAILFSSLCNLAFPGILITRYIVAP